MNIQVLGSVLLLATLSWQLGLSQDKNIEPTGSDNSFDGQTNCRHLNDVRLVAMKDSETGQRTVEVQICNEQLTWEDICVATVDNIAGVCKNLGGTTLEPTSSREMRVCYITNLSAKIIECLRDCSHRCLGFMTSTTPATPTKSTIDFTKPVARDTATDTVEVSLPTNSSTIMRNRTERNLAVIIGGTLAGLMLVMIVVILIIVVVLYYKAKHKRENLTWESPNTAGISDQDNDSLTERYQPSHNYKAPQPADYEVFQPSSVSTVASNMPLLDTDPQPYEVLEGYTRQATGDSQDTNRVYETVNNMISTQENECNSSADGHIYFILEPRDDVQVSS